MSASSHTDFEWNMSQWGRQTHLASRPPSWYVAPPRNLSSNTHWKGVVTNQWALAYPVSHVYRWPDGSGGSYIRAILVSTPTQTSVWDDLLCQQTFMTFGRGLDHPIPLVARFLEVYKEVRVLLHVLLLLPHIILIHFLHPSILST